ncbi:MAG TPA: hypothetical protein VE956_18105 [Nodularia sp. (in: cyanobacteria)]|nr:hypothetical protein [Nodularia sp. (in: cyanobacteria)]
MSIALGFCESNWLEMKPEYIELEPVAARLNDRNEQSIAKLF